MDGETRTAYAAVDSRDAKLAGARIHGNALVRGGQTLGRVVSRSHRLVALPVTSGYRCPHGNVQEEVAERTGFDREYVAARAPACAQAQLDETPPPPGCDPRLWVGQCDRFLERRQFKLNRNRLRRR